jgi:RNA polymerase sigma factor (sigma-70 family)
MQAQADTVSAPIYSGTVSAPTTVKGGLSSLQVVTVGMSEANSMSVLKRMAQGDKRALADCMEQHGGLIWALSRRMSPTPSDAEDATQEIFLTLWKNAARFDPTRGSEAVFIATLARRLLINRYRQRRRRPAEVAVDETESLQWAATGLSSETSAEAQQASAALSSLRPEQQRIITLAVVHGLSQSEIAAQIGMPLGTVKTLMRRGLLRVREMLHIDVEAGEVP